MAEFPFCFVAALLLTPSPGNAQTADRLPELINRTIHQVADSSFTANNETWSGEVWSSVPDFRQLGKPEIPNGFLLDELRIEESSTSLDPTGKMLSLVAVGIRGSLLTKQGKIIPVEVERALDVLHDQQMGLADEYPELLRKDSSLWSNVIQPALVALGAAAIIALFFFVRS